MQNSIRNAAKEKGLSQDELARACGVSRQTVNAIENNKYDPTLCPGFPAGAGTGNYGRSSLYPFCLEKAPLSPHLPYVTMELSSTERTEPNA